jgi:hypothetical protein
MLISPFKSKKDWPLLIALLAVFLSFYFLFGVVYANDSNSYLTYSMRVGPFYPLIIQFFDFLFPFNIYLNALVLSQELLAAYAIFSLMTFIRDRFSIRTLFWYLLCIGFAGTYFLRYALVGEEALYSNTILSEAITYPVYFLFVKYAFAAWDRNSYRYFTTAFLLALILACTRGQLIFLILVLAVLFFILQSHTPAQEKRALWLRMIVCTLCYTLGVTLIPLGYNYIRSGEFSQPTIGNEVIIGAVLYNSDKEDAALFPAGSEEREIVYDTLTLCEDAQLTYKSAPHGLYNAFSHYQDSHDPVKGKLREVLSKHFETESTDSNAEALMLVKFSKSVLPTLLKDNFFQYMQTSAINGLGGMIRTNSILNPYGIAWSIFVYLIFLIGYIISAKSTDLKRERRFMAFVFLCSVTNAVFCSFGVHELSRYVYYNFGFIYLAIALAFIGRVNLIRRGKRP